jgi:hypothetical protein
MVFGNATLRPRLDAWAIDSLGVPAAFALVHRSRNRLAPA